MKNHKISRVENKTNVSDPSLMANERHLSSRFLKKEENGAENETASKKRRVSAHHGRPSEVPQQIKEAGDRIGKKRKMRPLVTVKLFWSREELMEEQRKMMEEYNLSNSKQC